jgi:hypothetical protein
MEQDESTDYLAEELAKYAHLDDTELGEFLADLIRLSRWKTFLSEQAATAIHAEMHNQLAYLREECQVIEEEQTVTRKLKYLRFKGE